MLVQVLAKKERGEKTKMNQGGISKHILLIQYNGSSRIIASLSKGGYRQGTPKEKHFCQNANLAFWVINRTPGRRGGGNSRLKGAELALRTQLSLSQGGLLSLHRNFDEKLKG